MLDPDDNSSEAPDPNPPFRMTALQVRGRRCLRPLKVVDAPNTCPYCGKHVIVCPGCGQLFMLCPVCDEFTSAPKKSLRPDEKALPILPGALEPIVELSRWDGSDFCYDVSYSASAIVTKRVITWLQSVHANAVWIAVPVKCCVDNASAEQLSQLEKAIAPIGS